MEREYRRARPQLPHVQPWRKLASLRTFAQAWLLASTFFGLAVAEHLPIRSYTIADGLADDRVNRIVRDSRGFLWFCTAQGLSRFDGYRFTNFGVAQGLPGADVSDFLEARDGTYWVATGSGLVHFDPRSAPPRFVVQPLLGVPSPNVIDALLEDSQGTIWVGTVSGLSRLDRAPKEWQSRFVALEVAGEHRDDIQVNALLEDRERGLWIGTRWGGLYRRRHEGRIDRFTTKNGLPTDNIRSLVQDRDGNIWVGTLDGLCRLVRSPLPVGHISEEVYTVADGIPDQHIRSLLEASDGSLYVGTEDGLGALPPATYGSKRSFVKYSESEGLTGPRISDMAEDRSGNLWMATSSSGAMKMVHDGFITYGESDGFADRQVTAIFEDRAGELCVVVKPQDRAHRAIVLNRFDGTHFHPVRLDLPYGNTGWGEQQIVTQAMTGEWWAATGYGLARFPATRGLEPLAHRKPRTIYTTRNGLTHDDVTRLFEDSRGDLWVSARGLVRWDHVSEDIQAYRKDEYPLTMPSAFAETGNGDVWIGALSGGIARYSGGAFRMWTTADGLPGGMVWSLYLDGSGRLWIATDEGVGRLDDVKSDHPRFTIYTTTSGLASNGVRCITEDRWGRMYFGTGRGLDRLDPKTRSIKHYTTADGLSENTVTVAFLDRKGDLWFGGQGIAKLVPRPDVPSARPPIWISGVRIAGVERALSLIGESEVTLGQLGTGDARIEMEFLGLDAALGNVLRYQYKLEGADGEWSPPSELRTVHYANLGPGNYRFLVRAVDTSGQTSTSPAAVVFEVLPPLWMRWWFLTLAGLLVAGAAAIATRYRLARLLEIERIRSRIATDLHDDVGATLSQIAVLSEVARRKTETDPAEVSGGLDRIAGAAREMVDSMSDIVWSIDPHRDRLSDLTNRMRRFAMEFAAARDIDIRFTAPPADQDAAVGADLRRQTLLIFKEAFNNAVRHSACTEIAVDFRIERDSLLLTMMDNGRGFDHGEKATGQGLASMVRRARAMGGTWEITSRPGEGTRIDFKVPLGRSGWKGRSAAGH